MGRKVSEETKHKISVSRKERKNKFGFLNSLETRKKISESQMGREPWNKNIKGYKLNRTKKNPPISEETRKKRSEGIKKHLPKTVFKKGMISWNKGIKCPWITKEKKGKKYPVEIYPKMGWRTSRKLQVFPLKDTTIEVKLQNYLKDLGIEFVTHQYMNIEHGYQCDIFIPVQKGVKQKTIIEAFGNYWHSYPTGREIDTLRCSELRDAGFRVLIFWENEIKVMELNDFKEKL